MKEELAVCYKAVNMYLFKFFLLSHSSAVILIPQIASWIDIDLYDKGLKLTQAAARITKQVTLSHDKITP